MHALSPRTQDCHPGKKSYLTLSHPSKLYYEFGELIPFQNQDYSLLIACSTFILNLKIISKKSTMFKVKWKVIWDSKRCKTKGLKSLNLLINHFHTTCDYRSSSLGTCHSFRREFHLGSSAQKAVTFVCTIIQKNKK